MLCENPPTNAAAAVSRNSSPTPDHERSQSSLSSSSNGGSNGAVPKKAPTMLSKRWALARKHVDSGNRRAAASFGRMKSSSGIFSSLRWKSHSISDYIDPPSQRSRNSITRSRQSSIDSVQSRTDQEEERLPTSTVDNVTDLIHTLPSTLKLEMLLQETGADAEFKKSLGNGEGFSGQEQRLLSTSVSSAPSSSHQAASKNVPTGMHRRPSRHPSIVVSCGSLSDEDEDEDSSSSFTNDDLDLQTGAPILDSKSMLAKLGPSPTSDDLANVAAVRAKAYINECLFKSKESSGTLDHEKWESIPQYLKSDLIVKKHLGNGSFSDAFEVSVMVAIEDDTKDAKIFSDASNTDDLDRRLEAKFKIPFKNETKPAKDDETYKMETEDGDIDKEIDAMFASNETTEKKVATEESNEFKPATILKRSTRRLRSRHQSVDQGTVPNLAASICMGSIP
eukprot:CAMPEP_0172308210 /NCGR_PEP_ID=MMETSP1058-20130122/8881_1 /TAXON_ID=83371 /ORGANISM="Detonula confervacea, Strain CCMP 353" /LENGTH=449 /DNA_ID=CAMNT_0013020577 /DNA_START=208 /DNA_END=1553 /DNA_ORIENTATION=+